MNLTSWSAAASGQPGHADRPRSVNGRDGVTGDPIARGRDPQHDGDDKDDQNPTQHDLDPHAPVGLVQQAFLEVGLGVQIRWTREVREIPHAHLVRRHGYSSRPRRMASATAAARSETPSFS